MDAVVQLNAALAGRYEIERELGAGGMATVYLAHDIKHDRKVALKVLKPELAAVLGAERFVVEIKTTASLQHPHILPLFDSGTADGFLFYVMPWIQGETLRAKLSRETQIGVEEAVKVASDVADALDYAHRNGVIHRDIKPENILLHDGRPVVADFGIALAVSAAAGGRMTETGLSLGTPHYMSPEQATAEKEISARSDVYSLGTVLYEMLAGQPPHIGGSAQQIIMKIITEQAQEVTALRKSVPPNVAAAVAKSLEKLPADRFESAKAFRDALANPAFANTALADVSGGAARGAVRVLTRPFMAMSIVAAAALALAAWGWLSPRPTARADVARFLVVPPENVSISGSSGRLVTISPDGTRIVYVGTSQDSAGAVRKLFMRRIGETEIVALAGTERAIYPFFSPDGAWVGFVRGDTIKRVSVDGGSLMTVIASDSGIGYAHWGSDTSVVYTSGGAIFTVPALGGGPTRVPVSVSGGNSRPELLPGGHAILVSQASLNARKIGIVDRRTGKLTIVVEDGVHPHYVPTGHIVFGRLSGGLFAVPFDLARLAVTGPAVPVLENVLVLTGGATQFAVADNGTAVYLTGTDERGSSLVLVDMDGKERVLGPRRNYRTPRYSPSGAQIVVGIGSGTQDDLYLADPRLGNLTRLTFAGDDGAPAWSRDGKTVTFFSGRTPPDTSGIFRIAADGSGEARRIVPFNRRGVTGGWSPNGQSLVFSSSEAVGRGNIDILNVTTDSTWLTPYLKESWSEWAPHVSPDGRWVAYASNESGTFEVFVRAFPIAGAKHQVSQGGGAAPRWSSDSRTIYYLNPAGFTPMAAEVDARGDFRTLNRTALGGFARYTFGGFTAVDYDVHPNGKQFVALRYETNVVTEMTVVLNWFGELTARMGVKP